MPKNLHIPDHLYLKLAALYDQPTGDGPFPLVILLHGFTGYKEEEHISTLAEGLAESGIAALRFDAPGSGDSEGTWEEHYRLTNYLDDVTDVIAYAKANLPIDPGRIAIWGHSMGGFTAIAAANRNPDIIAVCASQPSSGWKLVSPEQDKKWREAGYETFSNSKFPSIRLPYAFFTDRQQYNALKETPKLTVPSLFIAGTTDDLVPAQGVKAMADLAPDPTQYLEFDAPHDYKRDPNLLSEINAPTIEFFRKHLGKL